MINLIVDSLIPEPRILGSHAAVLDYENDWSE